MKVKIFHTGDIHIGMKFSKYNNIKDLLIDARFKALENMIEKANDLDTNLFVVAGDLFNNLKVTQKDIKKAIEILDRFSGEEVIIIPGNHDYDNGETELWQYFNKQDIKNIKVLNKNIPYYLENLDTVIYPACCKNKHSEENNINWIKENGLEENIKYHIGLAHGAIEGLSADLEGKYYFMTMNELDEIPVDLWLIGHTHVRYPLVDEINDNKIFNAGTPEPDGLNYKGEGSAWYIELDEDTNYAKKVDVGNYRFFDLNYEIKSVEDLEKIKKDILGENSKRNIVRLNLSGNMPKEDYDNMPKFYDEIREQLRELIIEDSELKPNIDMETINQEFTKGSFPHEFLSELIDDEDALQIAYEIIRRD